MKHYMIAILVLITIAFSSTYQLPTAAYSLDVEDIDLDGDQDIVVGHKVMWEYTNPSISILENNGYGQFELIDSSMTFCGYQDNIFVKKVDSNEFPDIITFKSDFETGVADRDIRIIYNDVGSFDSYDYKDYTLNSQDIFYESVMGDIDSDGDLDVMVCSNNSEFWGYMLNDGNGNFSEPAYYDLGYPPTDIACGDLNNDGRDDFLVCNRMDAWLNLETGLEHHVISEANGLTGVDIADVDNDGDNDLIGTYLMHYFIICSNDGIGNFEIVYTKDIDPWLSRSYISDINGDNYPDIIYNATFDPNSEEARYSYIMYNNQDNTYTDPIKYQTYFGDSESTASLVNHVEDIDGNGLKDIITVNSSYLAENNLNILYQDSLGNFVENSQTAIETYFTVNNFELHQNFPNPFNPTTEISFDLQKEGRVNLTIYNSKGELVRTLFEGLKGKGMHTINFDASGLDSGLYFYKLTTENHTITRKMLFLK